MIGQKRLNRIYFELLADLYNRIPQKVIAKKHNVNPATVSRWANSVSEVLLVITPEIAEACLRQEKDMVSFKSTKVEDGYQLEWRTQTTRGLPSYARAIRLASDLLKKVLTFKFSKSALPDYLVPLPVSEKKGVFYVACLLDEVPEEMYLLDTVTGAVSVDIRFDVPVDREQDKTEQIQLELLHRLLSELWDGYLSEGSSKLVEMRLETCIATVDSKTHEKVKDWSTPVQLDFFETFKDVEIVDTERKVKEIQLSESELNRLENYIQAYKEYQQKENSEDGSAEQQIRDVSKSIYITMFTNWETWAYAPEAKIKRKKPRRATESLESDSTSQIEYEKVRLKQKGFYYVPRGNIKTSWKCFDREQLLYGGRNTGKTLSNTARNFIAALQHPGARILVVRAVFDRILDSFLPTFESKFAGLDLAGGIHENPMIRRIGIAEPEGYVLYNGSVISFAGFSVNSGLLSQEWDLAHSVETTEITMSDWIHLLTSIGRGVGKNTPYHFVLGDCNPPESGRYHWIFKYDGIRRFDTVHADNPELWDAESETETRVGGAYLDSLRSLPPEERTRFYEGKIHDVGKLVYSHFSPTRHVISVKEFWEKIHSGQVTAQRVWIGQDSGFSPSPGVLLICMLGSDGALYAIRGAARLNTYYPDWVAIATIYSRWCGIYLGRAPDRIICEHDTQIQALLKDKGFSVIPADKRNKLDGIRDIQDLFHQENRIFIVQGYTDFFCEIFAAQNVPQTMIEELESYVFSDKHKNTGKPPEPKDENDHWLDTFLYIVREAGIGKLRDIIFDSFVVSRKSVLEHKYEDDPLGTVLNREPPNRWRTIMNIGEDKDV